MRKTKTSRRALFLTPAALAAQPAAGPAGEAEKAKTAMDANRDLLKKVKLDRATEPAFQFKP